MKVLVTGGAGFIGSAFIRLFADKAFTEMSEVIVLDKLTYAGSWENLESVTPHDQIKVVEGDICDNTKVAELISEVDCVINFAAESHVDRSISNSLPFLQSNFVGLGTILETVQKCNPKVRIVQISTDEVYGSKPTGQSKESDILDPNSPYAASKGGSDLLAMSFHRTFKSNLVVTRACNNYGPFQHPEKFIPRVITNLIRGQRIPIFGDGSNQREWIHVDDHCQGIYLAAINGKAGEIFNIGSGFSLSNLDLAQLILQKMDKSDDLIEFVVDRLGHDLRYSLDSSKILNELGFKTVTDFDSGISETIRWYQDQQHWWASKVLG